MKILSRLVTKLAQKHAKNFANSVDRQFDPQLYDAVLQKLDKNLSVFSNYSKTHIDCNYEMLQDILFDGLRIGWLDNVLDLLKFGRYAIISGKYKILPYLVEYRNALIKNLPDLKGKNKFIFDLRKGEVGNEEINTTFKNIFLTI